MHTPTLHNISHTFIEPHLNDNCCRFCEQVFTAFRSTTALDILFYSVASIKSSFAVQKATKKLKIQTKSLFSND